MPQELQGIKDQLLDIEGGKGGGGGQGGDGGVTLYVISH